MKNKYVNISIILFISIISFYACNNSVSPEDKPGRRDYVWEVDTISVKDGYVSLMRFAGLSEDNVWACGSASSGDEIWNYNGQKWENKSFNKWYNSYTLYGVKENAIWLFTAEEEIYRWLGSSWVKVADLEIENSVDIVIQNVYGEKENDLYAVGYVTYPGINNYKGIIYHYDGLGWKLVNIIDEKISFYKMVSDNKLKDYKLIGTHWTADGYSYRNLYSFDGTTVNKIHQGEKNGQIQLEFMGNVGNEIWYGYENTISTLENGNFIPQITFPSSVFGDGGIKARNEQDVFIRNHNSILHYNGTDTKTILSPVGNYYIYGMLIFEKSIYVFFTKTNTAASYVYRGYLK